MNRIILTAALALVCIGVTTLYMSCSTVKTAEKYFDRGYEYFKNGKLDKAIADFTKTIRLDSYYSDAYFWRACAYSEKGNQEKAIDDFTLAIRLDPKDAHAYYWRASIYDEKGDLDMAIADYTQALRLHQDDKYSLFITKNKLANAKFKKNIAEYSEAIRLNPKDADAYFKRGNMYYSKIPNTAHLTDGHKSIVNFFTDHYFDLAVMDWEAAIKINPNYIEAKNALESARKQPFMQVSDPRWKKWEAEMVKDKTYVESSGILEYLLYHADESAGETDIMKEDSFHFAFMAYLEELGFIVDYSSIKSSHNSGLSENVKRLMAKHSANISVTSLGLNIDGGVTVIINIDTSNFPKPKGSNIPNYDFVTFDIYQK